MARDLIDELGGIKAVSEALGTTPGAIANWRLRNSIPWKHRHGIARMAAELGVSLPQDFWLTARAA